MKLYNIKDVSDTILNKLDKMINRDCQISKYSLLQLRDFAKNTDIAYIIKKNTPIYVVLLDVFPKHKMVYIHDVCVNKQHRGKGTFKKSLLFLKNYYAEKGYTHFTLDASESIKEEELDQKSRIHIFHSAGFDINTKTGYFTKSGNYNTIKTIVLLDNGETVTIQKQVGDRYFVKDATEKGYFINIDQIEKCFSSDKKQIACPMIMHFTNKNTTRKRKRIPLL